MPKIDRTTLARIAPDPQSVKAFEDLFTQSSDNSGEIVVITKLATDAQTSANAANLAAGHAQQTADSAQQSANSAQTSADAAQVTATKANTTANAAKTQIALIESTAGAQNVGIVAAKNISSSTVGDAIYELDANDGSGFRNVIVNGAFTVNQREYVSGTATTAANQYTFDRWRVVVSGQSASSSSASNGLVITAPAGGIEQVIEGARIVQATYVISWAGTATCLINSATATNGATLTLTPGSDCVVRFVGGTVGSAQLEQGKTAHPFEPRPYSVELFLCQRYGFGWTSAGTVGGFNANGGDCGVIFPNTMRSQPTFVSKTFGTVVDGTSTLATTSMIIVYADLHGARMQFQASGTIIGRAAVFNNDGSGFFSSEL